VCSPCLANLIATPIKKPADAQAHCCLLISHLVKVISQTLEAILDFTQRLTLQAMDLVFDAYRFNSASQLLKTSPDVCHFLLELLLGAAQLPCLPIECLGVSLRVG